MEKNGHLNWHIFLCQSLQNFDPIYLITLYKVILLTIITIIDYKINMHRVFRANSGYSSGTC